MHPRPTIHRRPPTPRQAARRRPGADPRFAVGLDLGQVHDPSALAIVERVDPAPAADGETGPEPEAEPEAVYHLRHLHRFPLGTSYPEVVEDVADLLETDPLPDQTRLVVDGTGVGAPVVDLFLRAGLDPVPVWITGGDTTSRHGRIFRVPKRDLASVLQVLLQTRRLKIARSLPDGETLVQELLAFRARITPSGNDTYAAWREGQYDDLVLALAMACWYFERSRTRPRTRLSAEVLGPAGPPAIA